jgi:hypothetical protein
MTPPTTFRIFDPRINAVPAKYNGPLIAPFGTVTDINAQNKRRTNETRNAVHWARILPNTYSNQGLEIRPSLTGS